VERVFTFAAMATRMHPDDSSRVFGAATDPENLAELRRVELEILEDGQISGLNGVLLGVAAESGLRGACLLGEMPHIFSQLPYPKASMAVLEVFALIADVELDLTELFEQAQAMDQKLGEVLTKVESVLERHGAAEKEGYSPEPTDEDRISRDDEHRIERLFEEARRDRSKAYELKGELDRLGVFKDFEDRFLDLFKTAD
jgi:predicted ATP-grasp superfamily ATP-dependent carboligase